MRILFLDSPAFAKQDMIDAFTACGITCDLFFHEAYNDRQNVSYEEKFDAAVSRFSYDFVFSFNYFPILSSTRGKRIPPFCHEVPGRAASAGILRRFICGVAIQRGAQSF